MLRRLQLPRQGVAAVCRRFGRRIAEGQAPSRSARFRRPLWAGALRFGLLAGILLGLAAMGAGVPVLPAALGLPGQTNDPRSGPSPDGKSMQCTHGGHVLAFGPDGVIVAAGDHALKLEFVGGNRREPQSSTAPSTDGRAQPLDVVTYPGLWDGVSLVWEATADGVVKTSYEVAAGADVGRIRLRYNVPVQRDDAGALQFRFETGRMSESAPVAWQEIGGQRVPVDVAFRVVSECEVGFALGEYDPTHPLTIDPTLYWNTFLGGSNSDFGKGVAVDGSGNITVIGTSNVSWGSPERAFSAGADAFVARLNSHGELEWNTFLGGSDEDHGQGVAVDESGNVTVVGQSHAAWGTDPIRA